MYYIAIADVPTHISNKLNQSQAHCESAIIKSPIKVNCQLKYQQVNHTQHDRR